MTPFGPNTRTKRSHYVEYDQELTSGKGDDHEGGTWYLGKRSFPSVDPKQRSKGHWKQVAGGLPYQLAQHHAKTISKTTPSSLPSRKAIPAVADLLLERLLEAGHVTESPLSGKRTRAAWGFHRSTKAAWYLGKRSGSGEDVTVAPKVTEKAPNMVIRSAGLSLMRAVAALKPHRATRPPSRRLAAKLRQRYLSMGPGIRG